MQFFRFFLSITAASLIFGTDSIASTAPIMEQLDVGVFRFFPDAAARESSDPSYFFDTAPSRLHSSSTGPAVVPSFSEQEGSAVVTIALPSSASLYGTGMAAGSLLRNGRIEELWNYDAYGYAGGATFLYESHPWILAVLTNGAAIGILADTTYPCAIDASGDQIVIRRIQSTWPGEPQYSVLPVFPVIIVERKSPQDLLIELGALTGRMPMPPKWALGYHQSRFSYASDAEVRGVAIAARANLIPCDAIWMDIDYMRQYRIFTFDPLKFPDPGKLNLDLLADGFHNVWMIDPAVKVEDHLGVNATFDSGTKESVWVKDVTGKVYQGKVWPGNAVFPDFTAPRVRNWWSRQYETLVRNGVQGVWNDMNEPATFNGTTKTMPPDNLHLGDPSLPMANGLAQGARRAAGSHLRYHNVYGLLMSEATRQGLLDASPNRRPFVLSRASYLGGQRYAATWTGDNTASWDHLKLAIPMVLNLGLSGQPFAGPDIGGYRYPKELTPKPTQAQDGALYARWMGFGALLPFCRGHYEKGYPWNKEPWAFGGAVAETCRLALERRYRLLPYLYTVFHESSTTGLPIARPEFFADPENAALRSVDSSFLLGGDLLVAANTSPGSAPVAALPGASWCRFAFREHDDPTKPYDNSDPDLPALYLRPGSIVPSGPIMEFVDEVDLNPLTLLVAPDAHGEAQGVLYEDDGLTLDYEHGAYRETTYSARYVGDHLEVRTVGRRGGWPAVRRNIRVRCLAGGNEFDGAGIEGETIVVANAPNPR